MRTAPAAPAGGRESTSRPRPRHRREDVTEPRTTNARRRSEPRRQSACKNACSDGCCCVLLGSSLESSKVKEPSELRSSPAHSENHILRKGQLRTTHARVIASSANTCNTRSTATQRSRLASRGGAGLTRNTITSGDYKDPPDPPPTLRTPLLRLRQVRRRRHARGFFPGRSPSYLYGIPCTIVECP